MVLTVVHEQFVQLTWKPSNLLKSKHMAQSLDGRVVQLASKANDKSPNQIWQFTPDGYIVLKSNDDLALTNLAVILPEDEGNFTAKGIQINPENPFVAYIAACTKCTQNSPFIHQQR